MQRLKENGIKSIGVGALLEASRSPACTASIVSLRPSFLSSKPPQLVGCSMISQQPTFLGVGKGEKAAFKVCTLRAIA